MNDEEESMELRLELKQKEIEEVKIFRKLMLRRLKIHAKNSPPLKERHMCHRVKSNKI